MKTTREALHELIEANAHLNYTVTEDVRYVHGKLSGKHTECSWYFIHVHYDDDGAGMHKRETFDSENLDVALSLAKDFVHTISK